MILPVKNKKDLVDVPKKALNDLEIVFVSHMDEVLMTALHDKPMKKPKKNKKDSKSDQPEAKSASKPRADEPPPVQPGV